MWNDYQKEKFFGQMGQSCYIETRSNFILHYTQRLFQETNKPICIF